jgi:hypothetical protein
MLTTASVAAVTGMPPLDVPSTNNPPRVAAPPLADAHRLAPFLECLSIIMPRRPCLPLPTGRRADSRSRDETSSRGRPQIRSPRAAGATVGPRSDVGSQVKPPLWAQPLGEAPASRCRHRRRRSHTDSSWWGRGAITGVGDGSSIFGTGSRHRPAVPPATTTGGAHRAAPLESP